MNNREVEARLRRAVEQRVPDVRDSILSRCDEREGKVVEMKETRKNKSSGWKRFVAAAAMLALVVGGAGIYVQGNAVDSVVLRGTRFAVSNFIPVVGGAISEGIEALGASMQVIRNSTGIAGIAGVTAVTVPPLIKIYSVSLVFHFFAAVSLPVSDKRFGEMLSFSGEVMSIFGSVILCMAFIFIVTAGVVVGSRVI